MEVYSAVCPGCLQLKLPEIEASIRKVREEISNNPELELQVKKIVNAADEWSVESIVDFEESEYLIASSPKTVEGASKKCSRYRESEDQQL